MCAGAALPSAHSRTACASARASDTNTYKGTSQHTPPAGLLLRHTDDQQTGTDTGCDALNCACASARARRGGTTTADFSSTHTGEPPLSAQRCGATASASRQSANGQRPRHTRLRALACAPRCGAVFWCLRWCVFFSGSQVLRLGTGHLYEKFNHGIIN
jgi:hypothetical protein